MKQIVTLGILAGLVGLGTAAEPGKKKTRDEMVLDDRAALLENQDWVYNDLKTGFAEAAQSKKPLMVIHRCIP